MTEQQDPRRTIRKLNLVGLAITVFLVAGVGGWAAATHLAGAVIAPGTIVVESSVKKVQHPTGGVVGEILVREGAEVEAGVSEIDERARGGAQAQVRGPPERRAPARRDSRQTSVKPPTPLVRVRSSRLRGDDA